VGKFIVFVGNLAISVCNLQNTPTDFIVNGKKVQEKVAGLSKSRGDNVLAIYLASNNGKKETGNRKFRTYRMGENDYYWIHSSIDNRFWIIPEDVLYSKGYISAADETKNYKCLQIRNGTKWMKEYEYNYSDINKDVISRLFI
jgi:hypothetical protein